MNRYIFSENGYVFVIVFQRFFSLLLIVDFFGLKHGNFFNLIIEIMRSLLRFTTLEKIWDEIGPDSWEFASDVYGVISSCNVTVKGHGGQP